MNAWRWGGALVVAMSVACASDGRREVSAALELGRTYTAWLYDNQYEKLWDRFSPEMQQTFGSVAELASFAGRAVQRLGPERSMVDEAVVHDKPFRIYTRTASFDRAKDPVLIQWSLAENGQVTGLVVRPMPQNVAAQGP